MGNLCSCVTKNYICNYNEINIEICPNVIQEKPKQSVVEGYLHKNILRPSIVSFQYYVSNIILIQRAFRRFMYARKTREGQVKGTAKVPLKALKTFYSNSIRSSYVEQVDEKIRSMIKSLKKKYKLKFPTKGKKEGFCVLEWEDKSQLKGNYVDGKLKGIVSIITNEGKQLAGYFNRNRINGFAIYINHEGTKVEGEWNNDKIHGLCTETFTDGTYYQGEYSEGKRNGVGSYKFPDGTLYEGEFHNQMIDGNGIIYYADGKEYSGEFKSNKFNGFGRYSWPDGRKFSGHWKNDKKDGFGIYLNVDPCFLYVGFWKDNKQNGLGAIITRKTIRYGIWKNGVKVEKLESYKEVVSKVGKDQLACVKNLFPKDQEECSIYIKTFKL